MRRGDFPVAWAVNDAVLAARDPATRDDPRLPYHLRWVWDGRPLVARRVLVRCYYGLGDVLQFARFLPALVRVAAAVTVEAPPPLVPLLRQFAGVRLHPFDPAHPLPPAAVGAEVELEAMELCHALRQVPDPAPFLAPVASQRGGVGFCWASGGWDAGRDVPVAALRRIAAGLAVRGPVFSLQRGPAAAQAAELGATDPLGGDMDVARVARLVAGLDAVVTVDTMVAHLAAALGTPTFVLLKHEPDWRWGDGRCPWYGAVRTVRQPAPGDWAGAVARLEGTLRAEHRS